MRGEALQVARQTFLSVLDPVEAPRQPRQGGVHNHQPAQCHQVLHRLSRQACQSQAFRCRLLDRFGAPGLHLAIEVMQVRQQDVLHRLTRA